MKLFRGANLTLLPMALMVLAFLLPAYAGSNDNEMKLQAILVWGTDEEKPADPKLSELDGHLKERLKKVFKWKNYFEVNKQDLAVPASNTKTLAMSPKCKIEVHNEGENMIEVKLIGEGKPIVKKRQMINGHELLIMAGDGKNDTAWFVVIKRVD
jgi:hypothetical protein